MTRISFSDIDRPTQLVPFRCTMLISGEVWNGVMVQGSIKENIYYKIQDILWNEVRYERNAKV